jgi:hypothetical protein
MGITTGEFQMCSLLLPSAIAACIRLAARTGPQI